MDHGLGSSSPRVWIICGILNGRFRKWVWRFCLHWLRLVWMQSPHFLDESLIQSLSLDHGAVAIKDRLPEIVEMLLPAGYSLIASTSTTVPSSPSRGGPRATEGKTLRSARVQTMSPDSPSKPPSSIFGPACALRILTQNSGYSVIPFGETKRT